jgi:hypothetical protein
MSNEEIKKIAKGFTKGLLDGRPTTDMCYVVCSPLVAYLHFCGIDCSLTEGEVNQYHHFWITLSDGRIVDPTADQFGLLNVWARKQPSYYKPYTAKDYNDRINEAVKLLNTVPPKMYNQPLQSR